MIIVRTAYITVTVINILSRYCFIIFETKKSGVSTINKYAF